MTGGPDDFLGRLNEAARLAREYQEQDPREPEDDFLGRLEPPMRELVEPMLTASRESCSSRSHVVPPIDEIAALFPSFEILEKLGQGGMGVVYKARQKSLDRMVALKLLTAYPGDEQARLERFRREAGALAALSHPNIVGIHDYGEAGKYPYVVMEYVKGRDLRREMDRRRLEPARALRIARDLCAALQYAHDHGIIHRDIKPENILLGEDDRVKIADFGLAKIVGGSSGGRSATGHAMGTPPYMAPEQSSSPHFVDHRADVYAIGVVLYEMLAGEVPTPSSKRSSRLTKIDPALDEVFRRALQRDPMCRFQQAQEVATELESLGENAYSAAIRPGVQSTAVYRRRTLVLIVSGTLVFITLLALVTQYLLAPTPPLEASCEVVLVDEAGERIGRIEPDAYLQTGSRIRVRYRANQASYVYVWNETERGTDWLIFPDDRQDLKNPVPANADVMLPSSAGGELKLPQLGGALGRESIWIVASRTPLRNIARSLREMGKPEYVADVVKNPQLAARVRGNITRDLRALRGFPRFVASESIWDQNRSETRGFVEWKLEFEHVAP